MAERPGKYFFEQKSQKFSSASLLEILGEFLDHSLAKFQTYQETLKNVFWQIRENVFLENFRKNIGKFSENFRHSWFIHKINCFLAELAHAIPRFTSSHKLGLYETPRTFKSWYRPRTRLVNS